MDELLRPNAHATLNARSQRLVSSSHGNSPRGLDNLEERGNDLTPKSDMGRKIVHFPKNQPTKKSPQFTRSGIHSGERVNFNMWYHSDDGLGPKPKKNHSAWLKNVLILATPSSSITTPRIGLENPFTKPTSPAWRDLGLFDRRVYILQKGAPLQGTTLPLEWSQVVETLGMEGFFTEKEFKAVGGLTALASRYETIRLNIQGFFKSASEPADKRDWPIRYVEDLKVFELGSGTKYWRHHSHSVVNPRSSKISNREQAVTAKHEGIEDENTAAIAGNEQLILPTSAISYTSEETFYESALGGQLDGYNGEIDDDQDHSFEEAFNLLQPSIDADRTVDTVLGDPFVQSNAANGVPMQPEHHTDEGILNRKSDRPIHAVTLPSDPRILVKKGNRDSKAKPSAVSFQILEDEPGGTPLVRKYISMNPASPGTDIQKENFEIRRSPSEDDLSDNYRMIRLRSGQHLVAVPPSPQSNRFRVVRAVRPRELMFGSPSNSEAITAELTENLSYHPWTEAPTVTPFSPSRRGEPFTSDVHEE